jgi:hypothetical protein
MSSNPLDNTLDSAGNSDHMVTFLITGNAGGFGSNTLGAYVIAFEDRIQNAGLGLSSDRDFNDAVFEVRHSVPVPEPSTYLMLFSVLGVGLLVTQRRRATAS